jgi:hypothetical protein
LNTTTTTTLEDASILRTHQAKLVSKRDLIEGNVVGSAYERPKDTANRRNYVEISNDNNFFDVSIKDIHHSAC